MGDPRGLAGGGGRANEILKAAAAGSLLGSLLLCAAFLVAQRLYPSNGPVDFNHPALALIVAGIGFAGGLAASILCLAAAVLLFGAGRLSNWPVLPAAAIGGAAGAAITWLVLGIGWGGWQDAEIVVVGGAYGASVAGFWTRFARS